MRAEIHSADARAPFTVKVSVDEKKRCVAKCEARGTRALVADDISDAGGNVGRLDACTQGTGKKG